MTPAAEYNFWVDPEAARVVLRSQLPIELVGWQLSRGAAVVKGHEIEEILALGTAFAEFAIRSNDTAAAGLSDTDRRRGNCPARSHRHGHLARSNPGTAYPPITSWMCRSIAELPGG